MASSDVDFQLFDADNHYYEATDAFTRHLDPPRREADDAVGRDRRQAAAARRRARSTASSRTRRFDPVARPGCLDDYFRGKMAGDDIRAAFGELEPISPAYREPAARVALMDEQGIEGCFLFPTLGVGMEEALVARPRRPRTPCSTRSTSGCSTTGRSTTRSRIFAAPYFTLLDPDARGGRARLGARRRARRSS